LTVDFLSVLSKRLGIEAADYFTSEVEGEYLIVRPREYLDADIFREICEVVREFNGQYVVRNSKSYFKVPLSKVGFLELLLNNPYVFSRYLIGKSHDEVVEWLQSCIRTLGFIIYSKHGVFCKGFNPDIVTNISGTSDGWILIDVVNSDDSLLRDIAGLQVVRANIESFTNYKVRRLYCAVTQNVSVNILRNTSHFFAKTDIMKCVRVEEIPQVLRWEHDSWLATKQKEGVFEV